MWKKKSIKLIKIRVEKKTITFLFDQQNFFNGFGLKTLIE